MTLKAPNLFISRPNNPSAVPFFARKWRSSLILTRGYAAHVPHYDAPQIARTRNIGIIAHIDAGKTTTTERMLYYSGYTRRIGDVDEGSTVTDFLPAERARGITIQSAAITFEWPRKPSEPESANLVENVENGMLPKSVLSHHINLIDTPGHADFTFEVRRSLRILDGAVCILDGVAGVEAQTEQVWKQASEWKVPRIVYVNKLDRDGAAFGKTVKEVASRLAVWPAVCQIPWWEGGKGRFTGVADVVNLRGLLYPERGDGKVIKVLTIQELEELHSGLAAELKRARIALVELLSEHDDSMVDTFLESDEDHLRVPPMSILASLRRCLLAENNRVIPLFAGASFRNIGVQPLLDAVVNLLPEPRERPDSEISLGATKIGLQDLLSGKGVVPKADISTSKREKKRSVSPSTIPAHALEGCALAFKVVNDSRKGVLVYIRVYSGAIHRGTLLYNSNLHVSEKANTLLRMYASDSVPVQSIEAGQIGVITGLKHARTGDTLIACHGGKAVPPEPLNHLQLRPIEVPPPVFFASIEPNSLREEKDMRDKLALLLREDPSLHVTQDEDTGQILLSGMGELHLEIARDRLVNDLKAKATMGQIEIGYRETILQASQGITKIYDREGAGHKGKAGCSVEVEPYNMTEHHSIDPTPPPPPPPPSHLEAWSHERDGNLITIITPSLNDSSTPHPSEDQLLGPHLTLSELRTAYLNGALSALSRGPRRSYQVRNVHVTLTLDPSIHLFGNDSTISALTSAARSATAAALKDAATSTSTSTSSTATGSALMEPVMHVSISVDEASLGPVVHDISSSRGGHVLSLDDDDDDDDAATPPHPSSSTSSNHKSSTDTPPPIDLRRVYAPPGPFGPTAPAPAQHGTSDAASPLPLLLHRPRTIKAKVPLKEMVGYLKHLRSITGGRGTFVMSVDRFEKMSAQRERALLLSLGAL
jgi:elongation factor G